MRGDNKEICWTGQHADTPLSPAGAPGEAVTKLVAPPDLAKNSAAFELERKHTVDFHQNKIKPLTIMYSWMLYFKFFGLY